MGSIQVLPTATRKTASAAAGTVRVREMRLEDYAAIRALQRDAAPHLPAWGLKQFECRRIAFPEGQMVADIGGTIVGLASSLVVRWDDHGMAHTWKSITAEGYFTTHEPKGGTLYAPELLIDERRTSFNTARALMQARRRLCRRKNLCRIIAPVRMAHYRDAAEAITPELYAMRVIWGDIADPWLRFHMSQELHYCGIVHGYLPEDGASGGHAALLAWLNPLHSPLGPPASIQSERARQCA